MRKRAALSITRLMAIQEVDNAILFERASSMLGSQPAAFGESEMLVFSSLALDQALHSSILHTVTSQAQAVRGMKISAEDKLSALTSMARLLLEISEKDAEVIFNEAVDVAGELDSEAIHEIALFAPLAERAVGSMSFDARRAVARDLAIVVADAGIRLAGNDYFPWAKAAQAITTLDFCLGLAATGRWEDSGVVDRETFLPFVLDTALSRREISPTLAVAFLPVLDQLSSTLMTRVIQAASSQIDGVRLVAFIEELAREELLVFGQGRRDQVTADLAALTTEGRRGVWLDRLIQATAFHLARRTKLQASAPSQDEEPHWLSGIKVEVSKDPFAEVDWAAYRFVSADEIDKIVKQVLAASRASQSFVHVGSILDRIGSVIHLGDRVLHLEVLAGNELSQVPDYERAEAIVKRLSDWGDQTSVAKWWREQLPQVVIDLLPAFSQWIAEGQSRLPALLEKTGAPGHHTCAVLLEGMERHVNSLSAASIYALVGLAAQYCNPDDAAQVIGKYANRLVQRVPVSERDHWDLGDLPSEPILSVARFLYALMGDIDVRIRWRAAHAVRCLARLGDASTIDELVGLYRRTAEPSYRSTDAPFYWLAARLWLVIALDRIASERPATLKPHAGQLLEISTDQDFPHIVIRSFAKSAVDRLAKDGGLTLDVAQRRALKNVNSSSVRRKRGRKRYDVGFDRYQYRQDERRRFHFDSMDTLPYWYMSALRAFADVRGEEFLDAAERWIVDRWGVVNNPWTWEAEPRKNRLSDSSIDHRHGSRPTVERFHTYLEWHAMWCVIGELMQTRALGRAVEGESDSFEHMLSGAGLTVPPLWLADLRGIKPLEDRLWFPPKNDVAIWVEDVGDGDFLAELGLGNDDGMIVVGTSHDTQSSHFHSSVRVRTVLISPNTASALVRALQTAHDPWAYGIPQAEIDSPPYKLIGWLVGGGHDPRIDERDSLRYDVRGIECSPSRETEEAFNIEFVYDDEAKWVEASQRRTVFVYNAWGDTRDDESDDRLRYNQTARSNGWRLRADKEALSAFLNTIGLDLVVEIELTRRSRGYGYSRYDEEEAKETRFDRILLLRRDGTIEAAEGRAGTWTAPRA